MTDQNTPNITQTSRHKSLSRRWFLQLLGLTGIAVSLGGITSFFASKLGESQSPTSTTTTTSNPRPAPPNGLGPPGGQASSTLSSETKAACGITPQVTSGPYYISGTPKLENGNLNVTNLAGNNMKVSGYIYEGITNDKPIKNAKLEIWHADNQGKYHPQSNGDMSKYKLSDIALRGYVATDEKGYFEYTSIFPAEYDGRVRHVHYRASADGYTAVTTQLTFYEDGDKTTTASDNVAVELLDCQNNNNLKPTDGIYVAKYDFRLQKSS
jgi:protocatechuate 3,4-dioxygenase beta subunit